ncbi:phytoene desaturase family protein [Nocardioides sp. NPDC101246]|uniref:phytoene desaturase family protein n=1 Tax=Nocardioides sp. NPDC101246 TaxID=3364336 RepID=UPI0038040776
MRDEWDYVVIGGGHNGLSAACTLAAEGASVLVLEKQNVLGGLANSHAYLPEAPDHVLSIGAMDDMFMASTSLARDLGLADYGYSSTRLENPYGWIGEDGSTLLLFHDAARTEADIRRFSPRDARAYAGLRPALDWILDVQSMVMTSQPDDLPKRAILRKLLKLAPDRAMRRQVGRLISSNLVDFVADTFESDQMRALCTYWSSMIGPVDADATGFYCVGLAAVSRPSGVLRPKGGMGALAASFGRHLEARGGQVRTGVTVEQIIVDKGRATGVRLVGGEIVRAGWGVLTTTAPQLSLGRLVPDGVLDEGTRAKAAMLPAASNNSATMKIDMAVGGRAGYPLGERLRERYDGADIRRTALMTGTFADQIANLTAIRRGEIIENPPVYMAVLSASDATIAPEGQDVVYLAANVPSVLAGGWADGKDRVAKAVLGSVERYMSGLDAEIGRIVTSPADFEGTYGAPSGCYFHVDMTPFRFGMNRPAHGLGGYVTPVEGYFLAGSGVHPGGGVSGWPGRLAAQAALARR